MEDSQFLEHAPCPDCGSSDALGVYSDGHTFCHKCRTHTQAPVTDSNVTPLTLVPPTQGQIKKGLLPKGQIEALVKRKITEETCKLWGYSTGELNGIPVQIANYTRDNQVVFQKIRFANKDFTSRGDLKQAGLYGQHLWASGKILIVVEGELDALAMSQAQGNKWAVVSVPNGAQGAAKAVARSLDYLLKFETVVFMLDSDEAGQAAALECAKLMPPGTAKIATLPLKDASDMVMAGRSAELINAIWRAKEYRPDGIVAGIDLWDEFITEDENDCVLYPWPSLNEKTRGLRKKELTVFTAGSGIGKSQIVKEVGHHLLKEGETLGVICLEESVKHTLRVFVGLEINKRLNLGVEDISEADLRAGFDATVGSGRLYLYDHFGSLAGDNLLERCRYLAAMGCSYIILDHLSIVVSGGLEDQAGNERQLIDSIMTRLRQLVEETGVGLILVSHLKRPEGKPHEEGGQTSLAQLRGSGAIGHLADLVIGCERNQQSPDEAHRTKLRVLKNRHSGETGIGTVLEFNRETGRMLEVNFDAEDF